MGESIVLSGLVLTHNRAEAVERCLGSLSFCDEVVVVDDFSTHGAYEVAKRLATRVEQRKCDTIGAQRAYALTLCRGDWVLWIDSDEMVTPELAKEIRAVLAGGDRLPNAFKARRRWHYPTSWGSKGHYHLNQVHLFRREKGSWDPRTPVHTRVDVAGPIGQLEGIIEHWPWRDLDDLLERVVKYSGGGAKVLAREGRRAGAMTAFLHALWRFFRYYVLKGQFRYGSAGFFNSSLVALEPFLKYARLWEMNRQRSAGESGDALPASKHD